MIKVNQIFQFANWITTDKPGCMYRLIEDLGGAGYMRTWRVRDLSNGKIAKVHIDLRTVELAQYEIRCAHTGGTRFDQTHIYAEYRRRDDAAVICSAPLPEWATW